MSNRESDERSRMIFDLPEDIQMAIKIKAVKCCMTTSEVITELVMDTCAKYLNEARKAISERTDKYRRKQEKRAGELQDRARNAADRGVGYREASRLERCAAELCPEPEPKPTQE